jgi:hypothetical protein
MINLLKKDSNYWKKHKPKRIGKSTVSNYDWDYIISVLIRFRKPVNFKRIKKLYRNNEDNEYETKCKAYDKNSMPIEVIREHSIYVSYIYDQEKKRQEGLDNKAKQIITNVSLLFSIIAFSSFVILNRDYSLPYYTVISISLIFTALLLALTSLILAVLCLNVIQYNRPMQEGVFDSTKNTEDNFLKQKTLDFFYCIHTNIKTNEHKARRIRFATWIFISSIFFVSSFTFLNIYTIYNRNSTKIEIVPTNIRILDTIPIKIMDGTNNLQSHKIKERPDGQK